MMLRTTPSSFWRPLALFSMGLLFSSVAMAQWMWIDGTGKKVFSDTAPPASIPDKNVLKRPGARVEPRLVEPTADDQDTQDKAAAPEKAASPVVSGRDDELEAKKKKAEQQAKEAAEAKRKAELDKYAKDRAENCSRAKQAKATMDSGIRIATVNAKGEREIMDDKGRAAEHKRIEDIIRSDCGPLPAEAGGATKP